MQEKTLFLLDAYALIYRAYYAFIKNPRINSKGINTSAIFGFTNTLKEIITTENPSHMAVVFDPPGPTFRHKLYSEYKAQRPPAPEDIKKSVPYIKEIIRAYNISMFEIPGFEADDTIGTIAKKAEKAGFKVYMMTPDKDYYQLLSDNIFLYKPRRSGKDVEKIGIPELKNKYSIDHPEQFIDILSLWGDSSDNVPGAKGVGEKTAIKLIAEFGSLDNLYKNTEKLSGKQKENIINSREVVYKAKELVTLFIDVPYEFSENELEIKSPDLEKLNSVYKVLEFRSMITNLDLENQIPIVKSPDTNIIQGSLFNIETDSSFSVPANPDTDNINTVNNNYTLCDTIDKARFLAEKLSVCKSFCFDTETTGLDPIISDLIGIAFSIEEYEACYLPVNADINTEDILRLYKPVFEDSSTRKIGQNIKFDIQVLKKFGFEVKGELFDTMIAHYLLEPDKRHNLTLLSELFLNYSPVPIENLIGKKGRNQRNMEDVELEKISRYACEDADITFRLWKVLDAKLKDKNLHELFTEIEMPLVLVLANIELTGVKFDVKILEDYTIELRNDIIKTEKEILRLSGYNFNVSSPKQLGEILFDRLKIIDKPKKTKSKQYSTSEEVLTKLESIHPIIPLILEFRSLKKLLSTYVDALPKLINPSTGKIHTSFNQAIASTGRLSSANPNLQNIPIRTEKGRELRKAFVPSRSDYILLSADYSQVELRLMAHLSADENMIMAFINNEDIHTATAAKLNSVNIEDVSREMRSHAKSANFGIIYGISSFGLSQNLNISRKDAKQIIDNYFLTYPGVKQYMDSNILFAREHGYVKTIMGRKRYLQDINSRNHVVRGNAERNAINAPVQGSAADIIKLAMIRISESLYKLNLKSKMILQVHDELIFDVYKPEIETIRTMVKNQMENAISLKVPLIVDIGTGTSWFEAH